MEFRKKVTVTGKRQVTLPVDLCRELGIEEGEQLEITTQSGEIHLRPVLEEKSIDECTGFLDTIGASDEPLGFEDKDHDDVVADEADPRTNP